MHSKAQGALQNFQKKSVNLRFLIVIVFLVLFAGNAFAQTCVDMPALLGYIGDWKTGTMQMTTLLTHIGEWKTGTNCGDCPDPCFLVINSSSVGMYDKIPEFYMKEVKKMWFNLPGESHSRGYRNGLKYLYQQDPKFPAFITESGGPAPYREDALRISGYVRNDTGGWSGSTGEAAWFANPAKNHLIKNHIAYSSANNLEIAAIGFGWCWDMTSTSGTPAGLDPVFNVHWYGSSVEGPEGNLPWGLDAEDYALTGNSVNMDTYLNATQGYMDYARQNNLGTKVLFTTGPVDGYTGEPGYQRHLKHEYIRDFVSRDNSRILFDYADILTHNDSGEEYTKTWNTIYVYPQIHPDNLVNLGFSQTDDGDHIGEVGALRLGKATWVLMARLAGWDGTPACLSSSDCSNGATCTEGICVSP